MPFSRGLLQPCERTGAVSREPIPWLSQMLSSPSASRVPLRVGSWPGSSFRRNSVIPILCAALQRRGATVVDVLKPWLIRPEEIDIFQIHWPEQVFWDNESRLKKLARVGLTLAALARLRCF